MGAAVTMPLQELVEVEVRGNHQQVDVAGKRPRLTGHELLPHWSKRDTCGDAAISHEQDSASGLCERRGNRANEHWISQLVKTVPVTLGGTCHRIWAASWISNSEAPR